LSDDWKQEITERLDRYRAHRPQTAVKPPSPTHTPVDSRATKIARAVASRYAAAPTYSELIAAETARAEALMAEQRAKQAKQAKEAVERAGDLFQDLDAENSAQSFSTISGETSVAFTGVSGGEQALPQRQGYASVTEPTHPTVPGTAVMPQFAARSREMRLHQAEPEPEPSLEDLLASSLIEPRATLPSKLIEFPRELISPRRARPRLPEDPTRTQPCLYPEEPPAQLRIFEVQPETETQAQVESATQSELRPNTEESAQAQRKAIEESVAGVQNSVSAAMHSEVAKKAATEADVIPTARPTTREYVKETSTQRSSVSTAQARSNPMPSNSTAASKSSRTNSSASSATASSNFRGLEWASISLDKEPAAYSQKAQPGASEYIPFMVDPASIDRRVMAFAVDFAAVTAGFMGFLVVFVASSPHLPTGLTAAALAGVVYVALWVLYQMLFFSLSGATAGMLYAHIALCTFDDQNPTRRALQRRLAAWWMSLLPLGIGFLWCFVDEDNLCWHDRITRTYQREY